MITLFPGPYIFHRSIEQHTMHKQSILNKIMNEYNVNVNRRDYLWVPDSRSGVITNYSQQNTSLLTQEQYRDIIMSSVDILLREIYADDSPVRPSKELPIRSSIREVWWNVYHENDYVIPHNHGPRGISGVYIVDMNESEENTTTFLFDNPYALSHDIPLWEQRYQASYAKEGDILLFPSSMNHYVDRVNGRKVSLSFNVDVHFK